MVTSDEDIERIAVSSVVVAGHGVEGAHSQRIAVEDEEIGAVPVHTDDKSAIKCAIKFILFFRSFKKVYTFFERPIKFILKLIKKIGMDVNALFFDKPAEFPLGLSVQVTHRHHVSSSFLSNEIIRIHLNEVDSSR